MPIINTINEDERIIYSTCSGIMEKEDFDIYIQSIWSTTKYYGFNELFDTVKADWDDFDFSYLLTVASTAAKLQTLDPNSKLAWVVLEGKQKNLTDFYKSAKSMINVKSRQLEAFYSREDAIKWLKS